jgi:acetate kinase
MCDLAACSRAQLERAAGEGDERVGGAIELFCRRVAESVTSMSVACAGLDTLVFTAGIGEHSSAIRERVCHQLSFLGVGLDPSRNHLREPDLAARASPPASGCVAGECPSGVADCWDREIGTADARVRVLLIHAREELAAARAALRLLGTPRKSDRPAGGAGRSGGGNEGGTMPSEV